MLGEENDGQTCFSSEQMALGGIMSPLRKQRWRLKLKSLGTNSEYGIIIL